MQSSPWLRPGLLNSQGPSKQSSPVMAPGVFCSHTVCSVQGAVCSVQSQYTVQCEVFSVLRSVQCAMFSVYCTGCSVVCAVCRVQLSIEQSIPQGRDGVHRPPVRRYCIQVHTAHSVPLLYQGLYCYCTKCRDAPPLYRVVPTCWASHVASAKLIHFKLSGG